MGYPILKLNGQEQDIPSYLNKLEEVLIRTIAEFGLKGVRSERQTGVWVGEKKLGSIGVAIKSWVTYHGFALNVNTDLSYFAKIKPCGLESSTLVSMRSLLGSPVEMQEVKSRVEYHFSNVFQRNLCVANPQTLKIEISRKLSPREVRV